MTTTPDKLGRVCSATDGVWRCGLVEGHLGAHMADDAPAYWHDAPGRSPSLDQLACAWELAGALGLPFVVRDNGDLAVEPDALDEWWAKNREAVTAAYRKWHPDVTTPARVPSPEATP